jgi:CheY-like chemotaxis protein
MIPRILIVDDSPEIHRDFKMILASKQSAAGLDQLAADLFGESNAAANGFRCELEFASQGEIAIEMVRKALKENRPYGMAFVDVRMPPGMDGVQTIAALRKIDPAMKFSICSAYSDYTPEEASRKVGLSNGLIFIIKPFDADIVRQLAQRLSSRDVPAMAG